MSKAVRKLRKRIERCRRLLALGIIAQKAGDDAEEARYLSLYERQFHKLPLQHQLVVQHDIDVVIPMRALFDQLGVLGVRDLAAREGWAAEFNTR